MPNIVLSEEDRARLGAPEKLPIHLGSVTNREAIELRKVLGFATPTVWRDRLVGGPLLDGGGDPVYLHRRDDEDEGEARRVAYDVDPAAWTGAVWIALRRANIHVALAELEFDLDAMELESDDEPADLVDEAAPGKAEADPADSTT